MYIERALYEKTEKVFKAEYLFEYLIGGRNLYLECCSVSLFTFV